MKRYLDEMEIDAVVDLVIDAKAANVLMLLESLARGDDSAVYGAYEQWVADNNEWLDGIKNKIINMNNEARKVEANESTN